MRRQCLSVVLAGALVGALIVIEQATPAGAALAPKVPRVLRAVEATTNWDESIDFSCRFEGISDPVVNVLFVTTSYWDFDGTSKSGSWSAGYGNPDELWLTASAGPITETHDLSETRPVEGSDTPFLWHHNPHGGGIFRGAWASWGSAVVCELLVGGVEIPAFDVPADNATYSTTTDFSGGVAAGVSGVPGIAVNQSIEVSANGYLFSFLFPQNGSTEVSGPRGEYSTGFGKFPFIGVASKSQGPWRFEINAAAPDHPVVFASINVPSALFPGTNR